MFEPEFLLASLIVVLIPGTGAIYTITTAQRTDLLWRARNVLSWVATELDS